MKPPRRRRGFQEAAISGVNIVPVIDLCLVLLVILLILSPMLDKPPVNVTLPTARFQEEKQDNITVTLDPQGTLAINSDVVKAEDLQRYLSVLLRQYDASILVILRADKEVRYQALTDLLKTVKEAGAKNVALGTEQPKKEAGLRPNAAP